MAFRELIKKKVSKKKACKWILTFVCVAILFFIGQSAVKKAEGNISKNDIDMVEAFYQNNEIVDEDINETVPDAELIDINNATVDELKTLHGIGAKKAEAIVELREKMHGFKTVDDIRCVDGIGEKIALQIRKFIKVGKYIEGK